MTFSVEKKPLEAGEPAFCSCSIVFGSSRLKMLIGTQPEIAAPGVPQCNPVASTNDGPVIWLISVMLGRPYVVVCWLKWP